MPSDSDTDLAGPWLRCGLTATSCLGPTTAARPSQRRRRSLIRGDRAWPGVKGIF